MIKEKNKITQGQLMFWMIQIQVEVTVLQVPYVAHIKAKQSAWIAILITGVCAQILILLIWSLCERFPSSHLFQFLPQIAGNLVGKLTGMAYSLYFLIMGSIVLMTFHVVIGKWILIKTPTWVTSFLLLIPAIYLARDHLRTIARFFVLASLLFVFLIPPILYAFKFLNLSYLLPIKTVGWKDILTGSLDVTFAFLGFETLLLLYTFVQGKGNGKLKAISAGNLFVTLLYIVMTVLALAVFSPGQLSYIPEPILFMLKGFTTPVINRLDILFLSVWYVKVFTTFTAYLYCAAYGLGHYFHRGQHTKAVPYAAAVCYVLSLIPSDPSMHEYILTGAIRLSFLFTMGFPLLFLLLSILFKRKEASL
ncbi:GerAB/ArcD/ProY family transporter [Desmospora activa]|uniref:Spore germination protein (Amino acid permease) n=1 Tax=Desmospora activa DSM 45169 TaxID=1121389 RepID=A0A2T4Z3W1_9BACL|nr:GerAB/ArcD/ProY family transporter [Desmospora activa]PTM56582.1 spore germination protein (amino acid permease) [Desmospora activa DSM 45169]